MINPGIAGFDNEAYLTAQMQAFTARLSSDNPNVIEFGGKPFGDHHASRVLPGYDPDAKAYIIGSLLDEMGPTRTALTVNAMDILEQPDGRRVARRIRGDSSLTYDDEMIRIADEARDIHHIPITDAVVTVTPDNLSLPNQIFLSRYVDRLRQNFDRVHLKGLIQGYPNVQTTALPYSLLRDEPITTGSENLLIMSPGGGSGKFGVAVTEMAHMMDRGKVPNFIKFETFPVFRLAKDHPLNMAFLAATADLPNTLVALSSGDGELTNYDKDVENLALLRRLTQCFPELDTENLNFRLPTDMGVNVIEAAITDETVVVRACFEEIVRRVERYTREVGAGNETTDTVDRTVGYLGSLGLRSA